MKKTTIISALALSFMMLLSFNADAQKFPPLDKSPMDAASFPSSYKESNKIVRIIYSRPQLKGRSIEKLVPQGEVWRTGANEAAEITFYYPMLVAEKEIEAGTYTFYLKREKDVWYGMLSTDLNVWGSYFYNDKNTVAEFRIPEMKDDTEIEAFSIMFRDSGSTEETSMLIGWGNTRLEIPFKKL